MVILNSVGLDEKVKWGSSLGKMAWQLLKKLNINLLYNPALSLLGIYPREMKTYVRTKTSLWIFIQALFIIVPKQKQSRCLSVIEWIGKMWYIHLAKYHLVMKKEWNADNCSNTYEPQKHYAKWEKPEVGYILCDSIVKMSRKGNSVEIASRLVVTEDGGRSKY